jgi:catechol 2,3-dioxygenase
MQQPQELKQSSEAVASLHPATDVSTVTLKVADLRRSVLFYTQVIGLEVFRQDKQIAILGVGQRPILTLEEVNEARPQPRSTTGLYHAAILFPDRHALAVKMAQIASIRYPFGYSDHLVSEAFYLSDPDDNGLELYRDRPRSEWTWVNNRIQMASDPIDFDSFFGEIKEGEEALSNPAAADGTKLGHMHLRVADIDTAEKFYHGVLGFDVVAKLPGALFVSAGGYHHHLGMNTWESRNGKQPIEPSAGLREFSISLPDRAELDRLTGQIEAAGVQVEREKDSTVVLDPFQNRVRLILQDQLVRS